MQTLHPAPLSQPLPQHTRSHLPAASPAHRRGPASAAPPPAAAPLPPPAQPPQQSHSPGQLPRRGTAPLRNVPSPAPWPAWNLPSPWRPAPCAAPPAASAAACSESLPPWPQPLPQSAGGRERKQGTQGCRLRWHEDRLLNNAATNPKLLPPSSQIPSLAPSAPAHSSLSPPVHSGHQPAAPAGCGWKRRGHRPPQRRPARSGRLAQPAQHCRGRSREGKA